VKTLDRSKLPCKFEKLTPGDWVPYGSTQAQLPSDFECQWNGKEKDWPAIEKFLNICKDCSSECPGYQPVEVKFCKKHQEEYPGNDWCKSCEEELYTGKKVTL